MPYDVFISYSRKDNVALQNGKGWVTHFYESLHHYLNAPLNREPSIFFDVAEMRGNDRLTIRIETALEDSRILLPIVSSNFLNSPWCIKELNYFQTHHNLPGDVRSRIFPIIKTPLTPAQQANLPALLDDNIYGEFYNYVLAGQKLQVFDPNFGGESQSNFYLRTSDLARQIAEFIGLNENVRVEPEKEPALIYLAEPSPDLLEQYYEIKRDLEQRKDLKKIEFDFFIPDAKKSTDANLYEQQVREDIERCRLVINLIGKEPNSFPKATTRSHIQIQTETAAEFDGNPGFKRLVWIPRNAAGEDQDHQDFINEIREKGVSGDGLMQDSFEQFKSRIIEILENKPPPPPPPPPPDESWFYIICDKSDLDSVSKLEDLLQELDYPIFSSRDYLKPSIENETDKSIIETHNDFLTRCNGVLIFWNKAGLPWVKKNLFDLQRSGAIRNGQPIDFQAVLIDGADDDEKIRFRTPPPRNCYKIKYDELSTILSRQNQ